MTFPDVLMRRVNGSLRSCSTNIFAPVESTRSNAPSTITLNVATDADPQVFLKSLAAPVGWTLDEPRLSTSKGSATLAIQMRREKKSGGTP